MKKSVLILMVMLCSLVLFTGCGKDKKANEDTIETNFFVSELTTAAEEEEKNDEKECLEALESIEVDVLSTVIVDYEQAEINGYLVHSDDYKKGTIITLGIKFPRDTYYNYFSSLKVCGETAEDVNGEPAVQTSYNTAWINKDGDYALMVIRIGGEVDTSKASVKLLGKINSVEVTKDFANDGETIGFDSAKAAFIDEYDNFGCGSSVVKLMGRHYIINRRYISSTSWGKEDSNDCSVTNQSYVLVPIENGFERTLTESDVRMNISSNITNTSAELLVNKNGAIDLSTIDCQTTIEVKIVRIVTEQKNDDGSYNQEVYDEIDKDKTELLNSIVLNIEDGDGNIVSLKMN